MAAKKADLIPIGRRFSVNAETPFIKGILIANYQPGYGYRVTEVNQEFVSDLYAKGVAFDEPQRAASMTGVAGGKVTGKIVTD